MKKIILTLSLLVFVSCNNTSEDTTITTLKNNTWIDDSCNAITQFDANGNPYHQYFKSVYYFKNTYIKERASEYSDEHCTNSLNTYSDQNFTYYDLGLKATKSNYDIHDIKLQKHSEEQDGYYAIYHNKLCFSKSLYANINYKETYIDSNGNQFTYNGVGINIYSTRTNEIDYINCLIKK